MLVRLSAESKGVDRGQMELVKQGFGRGSAIWRARWSRKKGEEMSGAQERQQHEILDSGRTETLREGDACHER